MFSSHAGIQNGNIYAFKLGDSGCESFDRGIARVVEPVDFNDTGAFGLSVDLCFGSFRFLMERTARMSLLALRRMKSLDTSLPRPMYAPVTMMVLPEKSAVGTGGLNATWVWKSLKMPMMQNVHERGVMVPSVSTYFHSCLSDPWVCTIHWGDVTMLMPPGMKVWIMRDG